MACVRAVPARLAVPRVVRIPGVLMANTRYQYVRKYEQDDALLPGCFICIRVDGRDFHRFSSDHNFAKPNDVRALELMNRCAREVMQQYGDVRVAYGQSDEYSFILQRSTNLFKRRSSKLQTTVVSLFAASYVYFWGEFFGSELKLKYPPAFDARCVLYPDEKTVRDYLSWRQADCHINNLYNTAYWSLVLRGGKSPEEAENALMGTLSDQKNEILFSRFGINYNNEPAIFRKGSVLWRSDVGDEPVGVGVGAREADPPQSAGAPSQQAGSRGPKVVIRTGHEDIIGPGFWAANPGVLGR